MKRFLIISMMATVMFASCTKDVAWVPDGYGAKEYVKPTTPYEPDRSFKKVAYFPAYRGINSIDTTTLDHLTHVIFSFLKPKEDGSLVLDNSVENVDNVVKLIKRHNCKAIIALNGSDNIYTTLLSNPATRSQLIDNIVNYAVEKQFDGVDMDWEYPNASKGNDVTFGLFMQELSQKLHSWHKTLSMAVTAGIFAGPVKDGINQTAIDACDFVNLMAYDGINTDSNRPNDHSSYAMAERVLNIWLTQKNLPKEKAVLGLPAYGKTATNTSMSFRDLLSNGADKNGAEYAVNNVIYYYNGFPTIAQKTLLAKSQANGIMFWEIAQDARGENSLVKHANSILQIP
jgi:GH18 family chitinase